MLRINFTVKLICVVLAVGCPNVFMARLTFAQQKENTPDKGQLKKIHVNNATLNYIVQGEGEPVILVHGTLEDYRTWKAQIEPFSRKYHVISYSRRYHYPNSWPEDSSGFSVSVHEKDLVAFLRALKLERVHLVGHSFGGYVALLTARDNPELIRTLTLAEPPVMPLIANSSAGDSLIKTFMENSIIPSREAFKSGHKEEGIRRFVNGVLGDGSYQKLPPPVHASLMDNVRELKGEMMAIGKNLFPAFTCEDARQVKAPVLILDGEVSPDIMSAVNDALEECLPNKERAVIPEASHQMQAQNAQAFNRVVLSFFEKH